MLFRAPERVAYENRLAIAHRERRAAIARKDHLMAMAYDAALVSPKTPQILAEREAHFRSLIEAELAKLGPLSPDTAEARFATLLALRKLATQNSFGKVETEVIAPALVETGAVLAASIDQLLASGQEAYASAIAQALIDAGVASTETTAKLDVAKAKAAAVHIELATQAGDAHPGARVLHARIAKMYGGNPGALDQSTPALIAETTLNWTVAVPGSCGERVEYGTEAISAYQNALAGGYTPSPGGVPAEVSVAFAECPLTVSEWTTENVERHKQEKREYKVRVPVYAESCGTVMEKQSTSDVDVTVYAARSSCSTVDTGRFNWETREEMVDVPVVAQIKHRVHAAKLTGSYKVTIAGVTRDTPFAFDAKSDDDIEYKGEIESRSQTGNSAGQARLRVRDALSTAIAKTVFEMTAAHATPYIARGDAAAAAGQTFEAEQAYYVATRLQHPYVPKSFQTYLDQHYRIRPTMLVAALSGAQMKFSDLLVTRSLELPNVNVPNVMTELDKLDNNHDFRSTFYLSFGAGYTSTTTTGSSARTGGVLGDFSLTYARRALGHLRFLGGYVSSHGLLELDFAGGYGLALKGFRLHAYSGLGMSTSTGNQERIGPTPGNFIVPVALVWQYALRAAYAFPGILKAEVVYSKHYRTSTALAEEKRLDARLYLSTLALGLRYAEYFGDATGFFTPFTPEGRVAQSYWFFVGGGF